MAEQWPDVWLEAVRRSIRKVVQQAGSTASQIRGLCISGLYGGSGIPLDENMEPVRPCLIWMDRRASAEQDWVLKTIGGQRLERISQSGADPYYGYTKILWIKQNEPENWARTKLFLPPNAYVIYRLTGQVAIDYSSAGNIGGLFDMERRAWSEELLDAMGDPLVHDAQRLVESSDQVGSLLPDQAEALGLPAGLPVMAGGVDCVVATLGMGVHTAGVYAAAIGTSMCAAFVHEKGDAGRGADPYALCVRRPASHLLLRRRGDSGCHCALAPGRICPPGSGRPRSRAGRTPTRRWIRAPPRCRRAAAAWWFSPILWGSAARSGILAPGGRWSACP